MSCEKVQNLEFADSNLDLWSFDDKSEFAMFKVWKLNQKEVEKRIKCCFKVNEKKKKGIWICQKEKV